MLCTVCGCQRFSSRAVLWDELISAWQLNPEEVGYVNAQQGTTCDGCGANLRSIALANALRRYLQTDEYLESFAGSRQARHTSLLELNEAGTLSSTLKKFANYTFGAYPAVDMHALPYPSGGFDVVVHSDTLEHVANPIRALSECHRVLKVGGALCFTVPIIVGRMSRDRTGLPKSYHGKESESPQDYVVCTEFGVDAWTYVMRAGFRNVELISLEYPAAIAMLARKAGGA